MRDNWTDFERYVFEKLETNSSEHAAIQTEVALLKERIKPRKSVTWKIGFAGIGAAIASIVAAVKGLG